MKKFMIQARDLGAKAEKIKNALESIPPKTQELLDAASAAAARYRQTRTEILAAVAGMRADSDVDLIDKLRELGASRELIEKAGFTLHTVEMDLGPMRRLLIHLDRVENLESAMLRSLLNANTQFPLAHGLLSALIKADELTDSVKPEGLKYSRLIVEIGTVASVRVCWDASPGVPDQTSETAAPLAHPSPGKIPAPIPLAHSTSTPAPAAAATPATAPAETLAFGQSSFFERRPPSPSLVATEAQPPRPEPIPAKAPAAAATSSVRSSAPAAPSSPTGDWKLSALDRFKKMPNLKR